MYTSKKNSVTCKWCSMHHTKMHICRFCQNHVSIFTVRIYVLCIYGRILLFYLSRRIFSISTVNSSRRYTVHVYTVHTPYTYVYRYPINGPGQPCLFELQVPMTATVHLVRDRACIITLCVMVHLSSPCA